jgi:hypothetical protein
METGIRRGLLMKLEVRNAVQGKLEVRNLEASNE